jgi:hypothetical protein
MTPEDNEIFISKCRAVYQELNKLPTSVSRKTKEYKWYKMLIDLTWDVVSRMRWQTTESITDITKMYNDLVLLRHDYINKHGLYKAALHKAWCEIMEAGKDVQQSHPEWDQSTQQWIWVPDKIKDNEFDWLIK